jgi:hypothetical protein
MVNRVGVFARIDQSLNWLGMEGRRMLRLAARAIALIAASGRQRVHEDQPAGVTSRRRVVAPHFDFRLAAMRAGHVIRERSLQIKRRH